MCRQATSLKTIFLAVTYQRYIFLAIVLDCRKYAIEFHFTCPAMIL